MKALILMPLMILLLLSDGSAIAGSHWYLQKPDGMSEQDAQAQFSRDEYQCARDAMVPYREEGNSVAIGGNVSRFGGSAGMRLNNRLYDLCMRAKGYRDEPK